MVLRLPNETLPSVLVLVIKFIDEGYQFDPQTEDVATLF